MQRFPAASFALQSTIAGRLRVFNVWCGHKGSNLIHQRLVDLVACKPQVPHRDRWARVIKPSRQDFKAHPILRPDELEHEIMTAQEHLEKVYEVLSSITDCWPDPDEEYEAEED